MATYDDILGDIEATTRAIGDIAGSVDTMITDVSTLKTDFEQTITDAISTNFDATLQASLKGFGLEIYLPAEEGGDDIYYARDENGHLIYDEDGKPIPVNPIDLYVPPEEDPNASFNQQGDTPLNQSISYNTNYDGTAPNPLSTPLDDLPTDESALNSRMDSLESKVTSIQSQVRDVAPKAILTDSRSREALIKASEAKGIAQRALSKAGSSSNPAVEDSDAETPSYVRGGPQ